MPFDAATRNMVRRATRSATLDFSVDDRSINAFRTRYIQEMEEIEAEAQYHFDQRYFSGLFASLGTSAWLITALSGDEWSGSSMFFHGPQWLHYHLSCSNRPHRAPGIGNLMIAIAAARGAAHGLQRLHLGGGRTTSPTDSLFVFKQRMSSHVHDFFISRSIYVPDAYQSIRAAWQAQFPELVDKYGSRVLCYRYQS
jgi:hypothetical protein